jgi:hypothetical protein
VRSGAENERSSTKIDKNADGRVTLLPRLAIWGVGPPKSRFRRATWSALGHEHASMVAGATSFLPSVAEVRWRTENGRSVPSAEVARCTILLVD